MTYLPQALIKVYFNYEPISEPKMYLTGGVMCFGLKSKPQDWLVASLTVKVITHLRLCQTEVVLLLHHLVIQLLIKLNSTMSELAANWTCPMLMVIATLLLRLDIPCFSYKRRSVCRQCFPWFQVQTGLFIFEAAVLRSVPYRVPDTRGNSTVWVSQGQGIKF